MLIIAGVDQLIIETSIMHWPIFVGVFAMMGVFWKLLPGVIRKSMENGSGNAIRIVISSELAKQDARLDEKFSQQDVWFQARLDAQEKRDIDRLEDVMTKHDAFETINLENLTLKLRNDIAVSSDRVDRKINHLDDRVMYVERKIEIRSLVDDDEVEAKIEKK